MVIKYLFVHFFIFSFSCNSWAQKMQVKPEISIRENNVYVTTPSGKTQVLSFDHKIRQEDVKIEDLTFDGHFDLKVKNEQGATQIFYNVYLYSSTRGMYVFNKTMSDLPCLQVDAKHKLLIAACFHVSSCENWAEHYSVNGRGGLSLVQRSGTYCDPTGQVYSYTDRFRYGKRVASKINFAEDVPQQLTK